MIVHRIVVAHGVSEWCKRELGGTGSLMIAPSVIGEAHYDLTPPMRPFTIGQIDPEKGFVHIFDDTTLHVVMETLVLQRNISLQLSQLGLTVRDIGLMVALLIVSHQF